MSTPIDAGSGISLVHLGSAQSAGDDPDLRIPEAMRAKFPPKCENHWRAGDGTWRASIEELVKVNEGKLRVERPRHRLHWLAGDTVRVAKELLVWKDVAFVHERSVAVLACDLGELWQMSLDDGSMRRLEIRGMDVDERTRWGSIHAVRGGRICVAVSGYPSRYAVFAIEEGALRFVYDFQLFGAATVVRGRVLVGGAKAIEILLLGDAQAARLARADGVGGGSFATIEGIARSYGQKHGSWEARGIDGALAAVDAAALSPPPYTYVP